MKSKNWAIACGIVGIIGFFSGMEYEHKSSLEQDASDIPGITADIVAFEMALDSTNDVLLQAHYKSQLAILQSQLARANQ